MMRFEIIVKDLKHLSRVLFDLLRTKIRSFKLQFQVLGQPSEPASVLIQMDLVILFVFFDLFIRLLLFFSGHWAVLFRGHFVFIARARALLGLASQRRAVIFRLLSLSCCDNE